MTENHDLRGHIETLCEAGEDGGGWMGYYAKGHHDLALFAYAANYDYGHDDPEHRHHVRPEHVRHVWWRKVPLTGEPGQMIFHETSPRARGAFAATVADISAYNLDRKIAESRQWEAQGRRRGIEDALRFCAERFSADYVELVRAWNETAT